MTTPQVIWCDECEVSSCEDPTVEHRPHFDESLCDECYLEALQEQIDDSLYTDCGGEG